jgi:hypothetical protein
MQYTTAQTYQFPEDKDRDDSQNIVFFLATWRSWLPEKILSNLVTVKAIDHTTLLTYLYYTWVPAVTKMFSDSDNSFY